MNLTRLLIDIPDDRHWVVVAVETMVNRTWLLVHLHGALVAERLANLCECLSQVHLI